ncbi:MAG: hypothetical protein AAB726_01505 [Patescibacteria group bacterium]
MENLTSPATSTPTSAPVGATSLSWHAFEYNHQPKTADWYWSVGIVALAIAAAAVFLGNILLAILVVIGVFALMLFASRPPEMVSILIDKDGVVLGKYRYPFASLKSFWINENSHQPKLLINTQKTFAPHIILALEDTPAEEVRAHLAPFLPEVEQHESLIELMMERFGF